MRIQDPPLVASAPPPLSRDVKPRAPASGAAYATVISGGGRPRQVVGGVFDD